VADISEFRCRDGKLFLAGIWNLFDHSIVGRSMGERQTTDLIIAALLMGLGRRDPADDLIRHADQRSNIGPSSSRTGSPTTEPRGRGGDS
jgi:putative transposase